MPELTSYLDDVSDALGMLHMLESCPGLDTRHPDLDSTYREILASALSLLKAQLT